MALADSIDRESSPVGGASRRGRTSDSGSGGDQVERPFISSAMIAILMLIASEMMLFSGLIGPFLVYSRQAAVLAAAGSAAPADRRHLGQHFRADVQRGDDDARAARGSSEPPAPDPPLSLATLTLGVTFLAVQGSEWVRLVAHGLKLSSGMYGATFYLLIGCHGAHVTAGVIWLACVVLVRDARQV